MKSAREQPSSRLRALGVPHPVQVRVQGDGVPAAVCERRRWRRVDTVLESWRIDDEWWRRVVSRVYHRVVLEDGGLRTLFRDEHDGGWYLHG